MILGISKSGSARDRVCRIPEGEFGWAATQEIARGDMRASLNAGSLCEDSLPSMREKIPAASAFGIPKVSRVYQLELDAEPRPEGAVRTLFCIDPCPYNLGLPVGQRGPAGGFVHDLHHQLFDPHELRSRLLQLFENPAPLSFRIGAAHLGCSAEESSTEGSIPCTTRSVKFLSARRYLCRALRSSLVAKSASCPSASMRDRPFSLDFISAKTCLQVLNAATCSAFALVNRSYNSRSSRSRCDLGSGSDIVLPRKAKQKRARRFRGF